MNKSARFHAKLNSGARIEDKFAFTLDIFVIDPDLYPAPNPRVNGPREEAESAAVHVGTGQKGGSAVALEHRSFEYARLAAADASFPRRPAGSGLCGWGRWIERIKVNASWRSVHGDRVVWIKRRRMGAKPLMLVANRFFGLARTPVRAIIDVERWREWETSSFELLHGGDGFRVESGEEGGIHFVVADEMPGVNMTRHLDGGTLSPLMAAAAGRELLRAHRLFCPLMGAAWSHGDPHFGNFIYDEVERRARLIDFEMMHDRELDPATRHVDDVVVVLQDLMSRITRDQWIPCALAVLEGYGRRTIALQAVARLDLPTALLPRLWWRVRTSFLNLREYRERTATLRDAYFALPQTKAA